VAKVKLIRRGVKEVNKAFRKKELGYKFLDKIKIILFFRICILAADVSPVDVICHIPVLCEKKKVPYVYVKAREELGTASQTKRPTSVVMLLQPPEDSKYRETFDKLKEVVKVYNHYLNK